MQRSLVLHEGKTSLFTKAGVYRKSPAKNEAHAQETVEEGYKECDVAGNSLQRLQASNDVVPATANPCEDSADNVTREQEQNDNGSNTQAMDVEDNIHVNNEKEGVAIVMNVNDNHVVDNKECDVDGNSLQHLQASNDVVPATANPCEDSADNVTREQEQMTMEATHRLWMWRTIFMLTMKRRGQL
jgi:hypothetical protein